MFSKLNKATRRGFTLIEIMIVVLIIGILLAIAVPSFVKARESSRTKTCIANLKQIDSAKEQYAMDAKKVDGNPVLPASIAGPTSYIRVMPKCPSTDGAYTIGNVGTPPVCPNPGTVAPNIHAL